METGHKYKSVLILDDIALDAFVSESLITVHSFAKEIYIHNTSDGAIKFLRQISHAKGQLFPEVIFIDINMPVVDGFQFIEIVKQELKEEMALFKPKLVMLTSSIFISDRHKAREHFEEIIFVLKPLNKEALNAI